MLKFHSISFASCHLFPDILTWCSQCILVFCYGELYARNIKTTLNRHETFNHGQKYFVKSSKQLELIYNPINGKNTRTLLSYVFTIIVSWIWEYPGETFPLVILHILHKNVHVLENWYTFYTSTYHTSKITSPNSRHSANVPENSWLSRPMMFSLRKSGSINSIR